MKTFCKTIESNLVYSASTFLLAPLCPNNNGNGLINITLAVCHVKIAKHNQSNLFLFSISICDLLELNGFIIIILTVMRVRRSLSYVFWTASSWRLLLQTLQSA